VARREQSRGASIERAARGVALGMAWLVGLGCESTGSSATDTSEEQAATAFEESAIAEAEAELRSLIGRFTSGDTAVWTGSGRAADLTEENWGFGGDGGALTERAGFPEGPVVAWLERSVPAVLTILHPGEAERIELMGTADAGRTSIGIVLGAGSSGGHRFDCPTCPKNLLALGDTLTLAASGERNGGGEAPWRSEIDATLTRLQPEAIDWAIVNDLAMAYHDGKARMDAYVTDGERRVFRKTWRHVRTVAAPPEHEGHSCYEVAEVEAELWATESSPIETGVTLLSVGTVSLECSAPHAHGS
jgi:hypothetical protein